MGASIMIAENFLDFWDIFANELVGSVPLFIMIGFVATIYIGIRYFRMPFSSTFIMGILFVAICMSAQYIQFGWAWILVIVGLLFFGALYRFIKS